MTTTRKAVLLTTIAATVLFTAPPAHAAGAAPAPAWGRCAGIELDARQECATLEVPLDHDDPNGEQIDLVVSRIRAADPTARRGTLLLVPGGPGEPGLSDPTTAAQSLPREVQDAYDLVSFDPRGVGQSSPVRCGLAPEDMSPIRMPAWPARDGDIAENVATAERVADACVARGGPLMTEISTAQVATMNPGPNAPALRRLVHDLLDTRDGTTHVFRSTSGLSHRYDLGSDDQPLVGRTAPDFRLAHGTRLGDLLCEGHGVALDFTTDQRLHDAATSWAGRICYAAGPVGNDLGFGALLIRPDGVVAWTDDRDPDHEAFRHVATRWFGDPTP